MKKMHKFLSLIGCFIVILISGIVSGLAPTNMIVDLDLTSVDSDLRAGDSGVLNLVVTNTGGQSADNIELWISGTQNIPVNGFWRLGSIDAGKSRTISRVITIAEDTQPGLHTLPVRITYDGFNSYGSLTINEETNWEIPIMVYGCANFQIDPTEAVFQKDTPEELILKGTTVGGANDVSVILSSDCASIIGSAKKYIGDLNPNEDFTLNYKINPDQAGTCSILISLDYDDLSGNSITEIISTGIQVKRYDVDFAIIDVNYTLSPGSISDIGITLKNIGTIQASDVSIHLTLTDPFTPTKTSEKYIGIFDGEETRDISFGISIGTEAKLKTYEIPLTIEYFDPAGSKHTVEKTLGLQVGGEPELEIAIDTDESDIFMGGSTGKVTISIVNKGFVDAKFLSMRLLTSEDYEILSTEKIYVGDASSDDVESVEYKIRVNKDSTGNVPLNLALEYRDDNNNQYTKDMALNLNILSAGEYGQQMGGSGVSSLILMGLGIIIGLFVALIVIWLIYKLFVVVTGILNERIFAKR